MRRWLAVMCLVLASTACASTGTPTPAATPSAGASERPPVGYVLSRGQAQR